MSFNLAVMGDKLKKYREQLEYSLDEVAQQTGIKKENLSNYEDGKNKPSGDEILILADFYKVNDYRYFISNEKTAAYEETETLFRRYGNEFSRHDKWAVQEFLYLCECQAFLINTLNKQPTRQFSFIKTGNYYKGHGEKAAAELRAFLGYADNEVPRNVYDDFRSLGIHLFRRKLENSNISGLYIRHPKIGKCVLINYSEDVYRQRFTAAHEAGHTFLDDDKGIVVSLFRPSEDDKHVELRANTFASHYLMPHIFLKKLPNPQHWTADDTIKWANDMRVSTEALAYALKGAGLIDDEKTQEIKASRVRRDIKIDPELPDTLSAGQREAKEDLLKRGLSDSYVSLCFNAYRVNAISASRLAEMLLVTEHELLTISDLYKIPLQHGD